MKIVLASALVAAVCAVSSAQVANPAQPLPNRTPIPAPVGIQAQMTPIGAELNNALLNLEQTAQQTAMDVGKLAIKKWKADSTYKEQSQHDVESIQNNVTATLPGLVSQIRSNPDNVAAMFKLYRNVDALWDVLRGLTESAGAFGAKSDYEMLENDVRSLSAARNALASQLDASATAQQTQINQLKAQVMQARAAAAAAVPPKKIIVDDNEKPKKAVKKTKKPAAKPKTEQTAPQTQAPKQQTPATKQ